MNEPQGKIESAPKKKQSIKTFWDYLIATGFLAAGGYYLTSERESLGAMYLLFGFLYLVITISRELKRQRKKD